MNRRAYWNCEGLLHWMKDLDEEMKRLLTIKDNAYAGKK